MNRTPKPFRSLEKAYETALKVQGKGKVRLHTTKDGGHWIRLATGWLLGPHGAMVEMKEYEEAI